MQAVKIVNESHRWTAIEIPRCACTLLKILAWRDNKQEKLPEKIKIHEELGYTEEESCGLIVDAKKDTGLFTFAVWRNPVFRLLSVYRSFIVGGLSHAYFQPIFGASFSDFVDWTECKLNIEKEAVDKHIRRQTDFYKREDVNMIVPISCLSMWLHLRYGYGSVKLENSSKQHTKEKVELSEEDLSKIAAMYAADYRLAEEGELTI